MAMAPWWSAGNPHTRGHRAGRDAAAAIAQAKTRIGALIGAPGEAVVLTSGATESNNLAILGFARARRPGRVLTSAIEHPSVTGPARALVDEGWEWKRLPVDEGGRVMPPVLAEALAAPPARQAGGPVLVCIQAANNEIGTIQPIPALAAACRAAGASLMVDAAQAGLRLPLRIEDGIDYLSLSSHKMHGPAGIGALYVRPDPGLKPASLMRGGGQQDGLRPGTIPTVLAVGFGIACDLAAAGRDADMIRLRQAFARLWLRLLAVRPDCRLNGPPLAERLPGTLSLTIPGTDAEALILQLADRLALSSGAACASGERKPSAVLSAIGLEPASISASIRLAADRLTTDEEIDAAAGIIAEAVR